jgi:hypothetical protein
MAGGAHYVNNADFLVAMKDYRASVLEAQEKGLEKPRVTPYIGDCLLKIATHLSYKANFINYSYREDMILDGVENCLQYISNFNPDKSNNPFAYFTQIIYYAFLRRIAKEKKQTYIKNKLVMDMPFEMFELQEQDEDGNFANGMIEFMQQHQGYGPGNPEPDFLQKKTKAKKKSEPTLDDFLQGIKE